ncbi:MAG: 50S ribosomal protein L21 [Nitrospirae bacterium]|nr:MAG: 50S ribosomal protein L21 [Nitrospirota bacterium]
MYAIVETGGKQYRATQGTVLQVEKLDGAVGSTVTLDKVLLISGEWTTKVGTPVIPKAKVTGEIVAQGRTPKIIVFKKKRRKAYRRSRGHRQSFTSVKITGISEG